MSQGVATFAPGRVAWPVRATLAAWVEAERGRFAPWLAVFMAAGAGGYFSLPAEPSGWVGAAALAAAALACGVGWRWEVARGAGLAAVASALGFAAGQASTWRALPIEALPSRAVVLTAVVRGVDVLPDGRRLVLEEVRLAPGAAPLQRLVRVRMKRGDATEVVAGDRVEVRALLRPPAPPAYPGAWDLQLESFFAGRAGGERL